MPETWNSNAHALVSHQGHRAPVADCEWCPPPARITVMPAADATDRATFMYQPATGTGVEYVVTLNEDGSLSITYLTRSGAGDVLVAQTGAVNTVRVVPAQSPADR